MSCHPPWVHGTLVCKHLQLSPCLWRCLRGPTAGKGKLHVWAMNSGGGARTSTYWCRVNFGGCVSPPTVFDTAGLLELRQNTSRERLGKRPRTVLSRGEYGVQLRPSSSSSYSSASSPHLYTSISLSSFITLPAPTFPPSSSISLPSMIRAADHQLPSFASFTASLF